MKKEFIPYEQALALKELGFDEPCIACYGSYTHKKSELFLNINNPVNIEALLREPTAFNQPSFYIKAPLYQQVFRWFRENHNMSGEIGINVMEDDEYCYEIGDVKTRMCIDEDSFSTHKQAELECLKKLIEIVKN